MAAIIFLTLCCEPGAACKFDKVTRGGLSFVAILVQDKLLVTVENCPQKSNIICLRVVRPGTKTFL